MTGLVAWSVLCFGLALAVGGISDEKTLSSTVAEFAIRLCAGCVVWALGIGLWLLIGVVL